MDPGSEIGYAYFGNVIGSLQGNEIPSGATLTNGVVAISADSAVRN